MPYGRSARFSQNQTIDDHFRREVFIGVIDHISQELDNRFDEVNLELLSCMSAFSPADSIASLRHKSYVGLLISTLMTSLTRI